MKNFIEFSLGIIIGFLLYSTIGKISFSLSQLLNFFTLIVLYFAVTKGEIYGAFMGTICGLIQDSFSLGVFGINGLTKTIIGYSAGYVSQKLNVIPLRRNFLFIFVMISTEIVLSSFLYYFISSEYVSKVTPFILFQPLCTAFFGSLIFLFLRKVRIFSIQKWQ